MREVVRLLRGRERRRVPIPEGDASRRWRRAVRDREPDACGAAGDHRTPTIEVQPIHVAAPRGKQPERIAAGAPRSVAMRSQEAHHADQDDDQRCQANHRENRGEQMSSFALEHDELVRELGDLG